MYNLQVKIRAFWVRHCANNTTAVAPLNSYENWLAGPVQLLQNWGGDTKTGGAKHKIISNFQGLWCKIYLENRWNSWKTGGAVAPPAPPIVPALNANKTKGAKKTHFDKKASHSSKKR